MTEATILFDALPMPGQRAAVPGLQRGQVVVALSSGRRMRVLKTDEWVIASHGDDADQTEATGPYAVLQALDDKNCRVIWPRAWYAAAGDQLALELEAA